MRNEHRQSQKRFTRVCRQELKRGGKRYSRDMAKHVRQRTGIKHNQGTIMERYIAQKFNDAGNINFMSFVVTAKRKGIGLVNFVAGKVKQTAGPLKQRKSPYVRVYKGKKLRVKRSFILKIKKIGKGSPFRLFIRNSDGYKMGTAPSIITLLKNSGFNMEREARKRLLLIQNKVLRRKKYFLEPFDK